MSKRNKTILIVLGILVHVIITFNTLLNGSESSKQSGFIVDIVDNFLNVIGIHASKTTLSFLIRKTAHMTEFMLLGFIWTIIYMAIENKRYKTILYVFTHGFTTALLDETMQYFVPNRLASVVDVGFDMIGLTVGVLLALLIMYLRKRKKY